MCKSIQIKCLFCLCSIVLVVFVLVFANSIFKISESTCVFVTGAGKRSVISVLSVQSLPYVV